jgi:hypothetical protein
MMAAIVLDSNADRIQIANSSSDTRSMRSFHALKLAKQDFRPFHSIDP